MKERPIIFSGPMVRAILQDKKKMTRRVIKPQLPPHHWEGAAGYMMHITIHEDAARFVRSIPQNTENPEWRKCPYGQAGGILYVRETWQPWLDDQGPDGFTRLIRYVSDDTLMPVPGSETEWFEARSKNGWHNRPSIHLPKWASRIWLKIEGIRVERVQDISEADAKEEGVEKISENLPIDYAIAEIANGFYKPAFSFLWDEINEDRSFGWDENPWVWVVDFSVLSTTGKPRIAKEVPHGR
jgi:hypothetical protein